MLEFTLIDEKRHPLDVEQSHRQGYLDVLAYYRWEHRVTIGYRGRRFMVFVDMKGDRYKPGPIVYAEEMTASDLKVIDDDSMWEAVMTYARDNGYLGMFTPLYKHKEK